MKHENKQMVGVGHRKFNALVLCEYFSKGKKIKRWLKPETVVEVPCKKCGYGDFAYAADAQTHICMDCSAINTENTEITCTGTEDA